MSRRAPTPLRPAKQSLLEYKRKVRSRTVLRVHLFIYVHIHLSIHLFICLCVLQSSGRSACAGFLLEIHLLTSLPATKPSSARPAQGDRPRKRHELVCRISAHQYLVDMGTGLDNQTVAPPSPIICNAVLTTYERGCLNHGAYRYSCLGVLFPSHTGRAKFLLSPKLL